MDAVLDTLWEYLAAGILILGNSFFSLLQNLHFLGPILLISLLALGTVFVTKCLNRWIITKRYVELEKDFHYWAEIRKEAVACEDKEKGKRMARNIDQAELNKAYYDYFFEGLLLGIARKIIPIFFMFAFINEFYQPKRMVEMFGREYVVQMVSTSGEPVLLGGVAWFFVSILTSYLLWYVVARFLRKTKTKEITSLTEPLNDMG
jgi:hypothetical protein